MQATSMSQQQSGPVHQSADIVRSTERGRRTGKPGWESPQLPGAVQSTHRSKPARQPACLLRWVQYYSIQRTHTHVCARLVTKLTSVHVHHYIGQLLNIIKPHHTGLSCMPSVDSVYPLSPETNPSGRLTCLKQIVSSFDGRPPV